MHFLPRGVPEDCGNGDFPSMEGAKEKRVAERRFQVSVFLALPGLRA